MASTRVSFGRIFVFFVAVACAPMPAKTGTSSSPASDTVDARRLFEENIDAIHKRDRARYLATYLHTNTLGRNGPAGLELGYESWSARRDSKDTTSSGVSERVFVRTAEGWRIAVTTAFGLRAGAPAQCK